MKISMDVGCYPEKPKTFDEKMREGQNIESGIAGAMPLPKGALGYRKVVRTTRDAGKSEYDRHEY